MEKVKGKDMKLNRKARQEKQKSKMKWKAKVKQQKTLEKVIKN